MTYGYIASMRTTPGNREAVVAILLEAAEAMRDLGCRQYAVSTSRGDDDTAWVTEIWGSEEEHDASLRLPAAREAIGRARPMLTGEFTGQELDVVGGLRV